MLLKEIIHYMGKEVIAYPNKMKYYICALISQSISCIKFLPCMAHPEVYWVRIEDINFNGMIEVSVQEGEFCSGNKWDFPEKHVRESVYTSISKETYRWSIHETMRMMFIEKKPYKHTPQYNDIIKQLDVSSSQKSVWGCRTKKDVDRLFENMISAFNNMKNNGYKTQAELGKHRRDEIQIYITEDGLLLKGIGGNHRILMAEILGIEMVPFVIHGAHKDFVMKLCQKWELPPHIAMKKWIKENDLIHNDRK